MNYFVNCNNSSEVKHRFRELASVYHPDMPNGDIKIMQEINNQYHEALQKFHDTKFKDAEGKERKYYYNENKESQIVEIIEQLVSRKVVGKYRVLLIGTWIWVMDGYNCKKHLKELGFRFHGQRQAWYWTKDKARSRYNPRVTLEEIACSYGGEEVEKPVKKTKKRSLKKKSGIFSKIMKLAFTK